MTQSPPTVALDHLRVLDLTNGLGQMCPRAAGPGHTRTRLRAKEAKWTGRCVVGYCMIDTEIAVDRSPRETA